MSTPTPNTFESSLTGTTPTSIRDTWHHVLSVVETPIVILEDFRVVACSKMASELLGFDTDLPGGTLLDAFTADDRLRLQRLLADLEPGASADIDVSMRNGYQTCELRIRCKAQSLDPVGDGDSDGAQKPRPTTHVIVIRDMTSEHAAHLTVLYSASRHRAVLEGLREGVVILNHDGTVTEVNRAASMIFARLSPRPLIGSAHTDLLQGASIDNRKLDVFELPTSRALLDGEGTADIVVRVEGVNGPRWLSISCQPIDLMTGPQGAAISVHDVTAHTLAEHDLAHLAHHDSLTGLFNRSRLRIEMQVALAQRRASDHMAILVIDIDGFKDINDSHGHAAGDQVLVEIAKRLQHNCRQSDRLARLGGDEFAVLLGQNGIDAQECADRLIAAISAPINLGGSSVSVGASIGIALARPDVEVDHILMCADTAMYVAKKAGKGLAAIFREDMLDRVLHRAELRSAIEQAIANSEFTLAYQPKMRLVDRFVVGFEALIRWTHPNGNVMSPAEFIPVTEETGQIVPIGRWVLEQAVAQLAEWQRTFDRADLTMAVNISARQLTDSTFADDLVRVLAETGIDPKTLTLELTETMLIADPLIVADALAQLRACGVLIAIDDYGSGNASISYLRNFAIDVLKVDRSLVVALDEDGLAGQAVVRSITDLANSLHMTTVVEGIERQDQLDILRTLGCDEGQGYYLARPQRADDIESFMFSVDPSFA